tara:strand:+ start:46 stop:1188 length:1143 start_codon:yes stop_codon:yes gene_type:complete
MNDDDDVNDDDGSVQTHDRLRERFHMPVEVADRVFARTAARVDAALGGGSDDILRFGQLNVDSNRCFATTDDRRRFVRRARREEDKENDDDDDHKEKEKDAEEKRELEKLVSSLRGDVAHANATARRMRKMVDERDRELDDLKTRILVLNREKAMLLAKDRSTIIREGTRAETGIERKRIERELVIPRGLAETDVDARETWLKLLRSPDASFVRFARAIRKREHEVTLKEKELEKLKGKEKLLRDRVVENEKELMHVKMKAERLESEARRDLEANSTPLREELERALRNEEETRRENARVKAELALVEGKVASAENEASLAKAKELAKEKECQMLADVVRDLSALGSRYRASDSDSSESDESGEEDDVYEDEDEESAGPK